MSEAQKITPTPGRRVLSQFEIVREGDFHVRTDSDGSDRKVVTFATRIGLFATQSPTSYYERKYPATVRPTLFRRKLP